MVAVFFVSLKTKLTVKSLKLSGRKTACQNHNKFQCFHFVLFSVHGIHPLSLSLGLALPAGVDCRNRVIVSYRCEEGRKQKHPNLSQRKPSASTSSAKYHNSVEFRIFRCELCTLIWLIAVTMTI